MSLAGNLDQEVGQVVATLPDGTEYRQVLLNPAEGETHVTPDGRTWVAVHEGVVEGVVGSSPFTIHWRPLGKGPLAPGARVAETIYNEVTQQTHKAAALEGMRRYGFSEREAAVVFQVAAGLAEKAGDLPTFKGILEGTIEVPFELSTEELVMLSIRARPRAAWAGGAGRADSAGGAQYWEGSSGTRWEGSEV